jgi:hypothetical protein
MWRPLHNVKRHETYAIERPALLLIEGLRHQEMTYLLADTVLFTFLSCCFPFQMIVDTVSGEMNRLYKLFLERSPDFKGKVSVAGHSLGSAILFDLLCHQTGANEPLEEFSSEPELPDSPVLESDAILGSVAEPEVEEAADDEVLTIESLLEKLGLMNFLDTFKNEQIDMETLVSSVEIHIVLSALIQAYTLARYSGMALYLIVNSYCAGQLHLFRTLARLMRHLAIEKEKDELGI